MILPINLEPSLTSYVQHAYPNAIIESRELLTLYVSNMNNYIWTSDSNDIEYKIANEHIFLYENSDRKSTDFFIYRNCKTEDEIILRPEYLKLTNNLTYIELALTKGKCINELNDNIFSLRWSQYNICINDKEYAFDTRKYNFLKFIRKGINLYAYTSMDAIEWTTIDQLTLEGDNTLMLNLHIYLGGNQYLEWKFMNYLQLIYSDIDSNGVWLDYFMFPKKGMDASYQYFCHFLDTTYIKLDEYLEIFHNIHDFIKWNISKLIYVNICLDEFYILDRNAYQKEHFNHFNLFYGYDDEKQLYYILGYNVATLSA